MVNLKLDKSVNINAVPKSEKEFWQVHAKNKWWRLNNLYWIKVKESVNGVGRVKFRPNASQEHYLDNMHNRDIILKARQLGFTTLIQIWFLDECMFVPDTNAGVSAHKRDDAVAFFKDKIKFAYDNLAPYIRDKFPAINDSANELRFNNGSVIRVGTSLRSGTNQLMHISEYGEICANFPERAAEVRSGTMPTVPTDGFLVIEATAKGRIGDFYEKTIRAQKRMHDPRELDPEEYKFHFFPWWKDPQYTTASIPKYTSEWAKYFKDLDESGIVLDEGQKAWYIIKGEEQGESLKSQYPSTPEEAFQVSVEGAYFSSQIAHIRNTGRICRIPIDPYITIDTFWDLGRDTTSIWFFQKVGFDYRFINYYEHSGEGMDFYLQVLKSMKDGTKPYLYGDMYLPHDGTRKSMMAVDGAPSSPAEILYASGFNVRVVSRTPDKQTSINNARRILPQCYFDIDRCETGLKRLETYRKEKIAGTDAWKKEPVHDEASHGADAFMTFTDGYILEQEREEVGARYQGTRNEGASPSTGY